MQFAQALRAFLVHGANPLPVLFGGIGLGGPVLNVLTTLAYGVSIALDAALGNDFQVTVTDAVAFTFAAPTNTPPAGFCQDISITIRNASGGAHGAGTWNAIFKTTGNVPAIADGSSRTFCFRWNGTNWVEIGAIAADVAN